MMSNCDGLVGGSYFGEVTAELIPAAEVFSERDGIGSAKLLSTAHVS